MLPLQQQTTFHCQGMKPSLMPWQSNMKLSFMLHGGPLTPGVSRPKSSLVPCFLSRTVTLSLARVFLFRSSPGATKYCSQAGSY